MDNKLFVAWFAGFFEGEGTITVPTETSGSKSCQCAIMLHAKDIELLHRVTKNMGGKVYGPYVRKNGSDYCQWRVNKIKDIYRILRAIYPFMGVRRRNQFDVFFKYYEKNT